jgi:hypothetical protein
LKEILRIEQFDIQETCQEYVIVPGMRVNDVVAEIMECDSTGSCIS